jgi:hypothetical protein
MSKTEQYHFEQHRKSFCNELAYFLRNPKLTSDQRKVILEELESLLEEKKTQLTE